MVVQQEFLKKDDLHEKAMLSTFMEVPRLAMTSNYSHTSSRDASLLGYSS